MPALLAKAVSGLSSLFGIVASGHAMALPLAHHPHSTSDEADRFPLNYPSTSLGNCLALLEPNTLQNGGWLMEVVASDAANTGEEKVQKKKIELKTSHLKQ